MFRLLADSADVTAGINARLISLRMTDQVGISSDTLEITLADNDPDAPLTIPRTGAELELSLGYDGVAQRMGLFVCDEVELEGWPGSMTIRARASPFEASKGGKKALQSQKSRSWVKNTKLSAMVSKIAKENGLEPVLSKSLQSIVLPHLDQTEESDLSFLVRVAKRYDAVAKPAGGKLMVAKRGESKTASGETLETVTLNAEACTAWRMTLAKRDSPGTVVAYWNSKANARRHAVTVGKGEPTKTLRHTLGSAADAKAAAQAELDRRKRGQETVSVTLPGDPSLMAESPLELVGFREGVDGTWLVSKVTHSLSKSGGYSCEVEGERPNDD